MDDLLTRWVRGQEQEQEQEQEQVQEQEQGMLQFSYSSRYNTKIGKM